MNESQFLALEGNIRQVWDAFFKKPGRKDYIADVFNLMNIGDSQFTDYTLGAPGRMTPWAGTVAYDNFVKGFEKQYRPTKYSTGIQLDRDLYEDKSFQEIKNRVNNIAFGVYKTMLYESVALLNGAFGTDVTGPDGAGLCSSTHHLVDGDDHQSNTFTYDLDYAGVDAIQQKMEGWKDDRGDQMLVPGDLVIAGPYYRVTCKQLFGSDKEAYTDENQDNAFKGMKYIIHPLITGKKWFMANSDLLKNGQGMNFVMRRDPHNIERDGNAASGDFNTEKLSWKCVGRWTKGWTNWFCIAGSNPA